MKSLIRYSINYFFRILWIFPIKRKKVLFLSQGGGQFSCNPKYIYLWLVKDEEHYAPDDSKRQLSRSCFWVLDEKCNTSPVPLKMQIKLRSLAYLWHLATAHVIITNNNIPQQFLLRRKQKVIQTWHGGGAYKRVAFDTPIKKGLSIKLGFQAERTYCVVSACRAFTETMSKALLIPKEKFLEVGMPRNDLFFSKKEVAFATKRIKAELGGISDNTRIVLYAPTYRETGWHTNRFSEENAEISSSLCMEALERKFGGKWTFLYRVHRNARANMSGSIAGGRDVSRVEDMQELLCAADVLITDYSSSMWDFSLTFKPCFIFAPDLERYSQEKDFYTPIKKWPFPISTDNKTLSESIESFDSDKYRSDIIQHHIELGSFESGNASREICELLYKICIEK